MPGRHELERMLNEARQARDTPNQPEQSQDALIREGLINFFEPVYVLMDRLHDAGIRLHGDSAIPRPLKRGAAAKAELANNAAPGYRTQLDANSHLVIGIAARRGLRFPEIISTARWRGRVTTNGEDTEIKLTDNFEELAKWVVGVVAQYEVTTDDPPPLQVSDGDAELEAPATREHRVIMLDDILNEEN